MPEAKPRLRALYGNSRLLHGNNSQGAPGPPVFMSAAIFKLWRIAQAKRRPALNRACLHPVAAGARTARLQSRSRRKRPRECPEFSRIEVMRAARGRTN